MKTLTVQELKVGMTIGVGCGHYETIVKLGSDKTKNGKEKITITTNRGGTWFKSPTTKIKVKN